MNQNAFLKLILGLIPCVFLILGLNGCTVTLIQYPVNAQLYDSKTTYPPFDPAVVFFFPSKNDLPSNLQAIPVAEMVSPDNSTYTYENLLDEFRKKAGAVGANAVVIERVDTQDVALDHPLYRGRAIAYRLYKDNPSDNLDLSSFASATQNPAMPESDTKAIYTYPGINSNQ
jgi:hypothetical protein